MADVEKFTYAVGAAGVERLRRRERPAGLRWNDQLQRGEFPDDYGFEFMQETADQEVWWPAKVSQDVEQPNTNVEGE